MNKERRKKLTELLGSLSEARTSLECILHEEEMAFANLPESIQESERGDQIQEAIEAIENAIESIGEAEESIREAQS